MEKKNSLILTVITCVSLLVLVVGATFAYYGISTVNTNNTSAFTVQTSKVGIVTMTRQTQNMHIAVSGADMAYSNIGAKYYSISGTYTAPAQGQNFIPSRGTTVTEHNLFTAAVTGGESDALYDCNFTLTVTKSGTMLSSLVSGDIKLVIGGASTVNTNVTANGTYDLVSDFSNNQLVKTVYFHGINGTTAQTLTGHLELNNTSLDQRALADKSLSVTIAATGLTCEQVESHATTVVIETPADPIKVAVANDFNSAIDAALAAMASHSGEAFLGDNSSETIECSDPEDPGTCDTTYVDATQNIYCFTLSDLAGYGLYSGSSTDGRVFVFAPVGGGSYSYRATLYNGYEGDIVSSSKIAASDIDEFAGGSFDYSCSLELIEY